MGPGSRGEARRRKNAVFASLSERALSLLLAGVRDPILTETAGSRRPVLSARRGCCWSAEENVFLGAVGLAFLDNSETSPLGSDRWERPGEGRVMYTNPRRRRTGGGPNDSNAGCRLSWAQG